MKLSEFIFGQLLSCLFVVKTHCHKEKYDEKNVSVPFFIDVLIVPLLSFFVAGASKKAVKKPADFRIYFGCILDGIQYYVYYSELEKRMVSGFEDGFLAFNLIGYFICLLFTYCIADKFSCRISHLLCYLIIIIYAIILTVYEKSHFGVLAEHFIGSNGISVLVFPTHLVLCNIISNEAGIVNYLFIRSPVVASACFLHFFSVKVKDLDLFYETCKTKFPFLLLYLLISSVFSIGCVVFTQKFGIVSMGMLSIANFIYYRFYNMICSKEYRFIEIISLGSLYIGFLATSFNYTRRTDPIVDSSHPVPS